MSDIENPTPAVEEPDALALVPLEAGALAAMRDHLRTSKQTLLSSLRNHALA